MRGVLRRPSEPALTSGHPVAILEFSVYKRLSGTNLANFLQSQLVNHLGVSDH